MRVVSRISIWCDQCREQVLPLLSFPVDQAVRTQDVDGYMAEKGWVRKRGKDLCPHCQGKEAAGKCDYFNGSEARTGTVSGGKGEWG